MGDILLFLIGVEVSRKSLGADRSDLGCCNLWLGNEVEALVGVLVSCLCLEFGWFVGSETNNVCLSSSYMADRLEHFLVLLQLLRLLLSEVLSIIGLAFEGQ